MLPRVSATIFEFKTDLLSFYLASGVLIPFAAQNLRKLNIRLRMEFDLFRAIRKPLSTKIDRQGKSAHCIPLTV